LLLVRHAEPREDARGRCYGTLDIGLSPEGERQAQLLADTLGALPLAAVYTSPRERAVATAAPLAAAHGLTPIVDDALRELDFGDFEGRTYEEIELSQPELYRQWMETPTRVQFPGGEGYAALRARAVAAMDAMRTRPDGESVVVVSHGGVLRAMLAACLSIPDEAIFRIDQSYAAISVVEWIESVPLVRLVNAPSDSVVSP
jgi:alpha-ribazole phosphatase/probable phosphoglycerate mutase